MCGICKRKYVDDWFMNGWLEGIEQKSFSSCSVTVNACISILHHIKISQGKYLSLGYFNVFGFVYLIQQIAVLQQHGTSTQQPAVSQNALLWVSISIVTREEAWTLTDLLCKNKNFFCFWHHHGTGSTPAQNIQQ